MSAVEAARAAGWVYWLGDWYSTDLVAILMNEQPWCWRDTAHNLCLAQGIEFSCSA